MRNYCNNLAAYPNCETLEKQIKKFKLDQAKVMVYSYKHPNIYPHSKLNN